MKKTFNTKRFNEAFKRNRRRFPDGFAFQLTPREGPDLLRGNRSQLAASPQRGPVPPKRRIGFHTDG